MTRSEEISENLAAVEARITAACGLSGRDRSEITLIAVTKNFPIGDAQILYSLGIREFGENRDEEGAAKSKKLPTDIHWHFQGQVQGRKIRSIASWARTIHSLTSLEHARKFDLLLNSSGSDQSTQSQLHNFFIQVNFEPQRDDRGGVSSEQLPELVQAIYAQTQIRPSGLMAVAPIETDPLPFFKELQQLQTNFQHLYPSLRQLSMGMSGDYEAAILAGATHLRIGSSILGSRGLPA